MTTRPALVPPLFGAAIAALVLPGPAALAASAEPMIRLPSGAEVRWLETLHDNSGGNGLTYRFRFLMPDLAAHVPEDARPAAPAAPADRAPIEIDTESDGDMTEGADEDYLDDGMITPEALALGPVAADDAAEMAADSQIGEPAPAGPTEATQDRLHEDVVWLCQNWVLPRLPDPGPRPNAIMISIADRDIPFGAYDPGVLQLFEAFRLPPDRKACEWEPW